MLSERGDDMGVMIELVVEEEELMRRLLNRAIEQGRADDNEVTIKKRFDVYQNQTLPLSEWFEKEGIRTVFRWIDLPEKDDMANAIFEFIDKVNA